MKFKDATVAHLCDLHSGGSTALCQRGQVQLLSGGYYTPSYLQGLIREQWREFIGTVKAARHKRRLIVVVNGDVIDGDHHDTVELITPVLKNQRDIASELIDEFLTGTDYSPKNGDSLRFTMGTPAHAGQIAEQEEAIAEDFGAVPFIPAGADTKARYLFPEVKLIVNGAKFYFRHQGPSVGRLVHTQENALYRFLKNEYLKSLAGAYLADYYTFAHRHQYAEATFYKPSEGVKLHARIAPSWQMRTGYGMNFSDHDEIGGMFYQVDGEQITEHLIRMQFEPTQYEEA